MPEMLATSRSRRANAGNKMGKMLEQEDQEQDDFYKNTYGGFEEEQEDHDYKDASDADVDVLDSDFDDEEVDDGVKSDGDEDADSKRRKKKPILTKSYKEPVSFDLIKTKEQKAEESKKRKQRKEEISKQYKEKSELSKERRSMRATTIVKTKDNQRKLKSHLDSQMQRKRKEKVLLDHGKTLKELQEYTQNQLLLEAEDTERDNLRSLEMYQKLELDKKRSKVIRQLKQIPYIRTHSTKMPVLYSGEGEIDVDAHCPMEGPLSQIHKPIEYCERTFVTYTNEMNFAKVFPKPVLQPPRKPILCGVTKRPAKYIDPLTKTPYVNRGAFKILRMIHSKYSKRKRILKKPQLDQSPIVLN